MTPALSTEVMLLRWSDAPSGATVTFLLPDPDDLAVFRGATVKRNGHTGTRYACVLVEISDSEELLEDSPATPDKASVTDSLPVAEKPAKHNGRGFVGLSGLATRWGKDQDFHRWLREEYGSGADSEETSRQVILDTCGIRSRAELDNDQLAAKTFKELFVEPYGESRRARGLD